MTEDWIVVHTAAFPRPHYNKIQSAKDHVNDGIVIRISAQDLLYHNYGRYSNLVEELIADALSRIEKLNGVSLRKNCDELVDGLPL